VYYRRPNLAFENVLSSLFPRCHVEKFVCLGVDEPGSVEKKKIPRSRVHTQFGSYIIALLRMYKLETGVEQTPLLYYTGLHPVLVGRNNEGFL
jgi:hypothetical protein